MHLPALQRALERYLRFGGLPAAVAEAASGRQKATAAARALPGRPALVATRDELEFGPTSNLVPAALLLWALTD